MSQQDNFFGGFVVGAIVGGVIGGVLGTLVAPRLSRQESADTERGFAKLEGKRGGRLPVSDRSIEVARQGLEDKIAQLNDAIDDVRQQLGGVNGSGFAQPEQVKGDSERS